MITYKHIGLLVGIVLMIVSFLFFGWHHNFYLLLIIIGSIISLVSYLMILFGREGWKPKILWTVFVLLSIIIEEKIATVLIDTSYKIYVAQHKKMLDNINDVLDHTAGDVIIYQDRVIHTKDSFTNKEIKKLQDASIDLGVYMIAKNNNSTYYGMWGFLDVRIGIIYWAEKSMPNDNYRHITGNWFY